VEERCCSPAPVFLLIAWQRLHPSILWYLLLRLVYQQLQLATASFRHWKAFEKERHATMITKRRQIEFCEPRTCTAQTTLLKLALSKY
jgi:hypothetical protein